MKNENAPIKLNIDDVVDNLLQLISGQALTIAKLEALNKKLMEELQGLQAQEKEG